MDMKAEKPAEGILKTHDFGHSKWYNVTCGCGQPDDSITFEVEADECGVTVNTYNTQKTPWWEEVVRPRYDIDNEVWQEVDWFVKGLINGVWRRIKLTWQIWVHGYVKYESTTVMSEQQALNYAETLKSAIEDVKEFEKQRQEKTNGKN